MATSQGMKKVQPNIWVFVSDKGIETNGDYRFARGVMLHEGYVFDPAVFGSFFALGAKASRQFSKRWTALY